MNMNAVGIDVSKRKSTVAILRPGGEMVKNLLMYRTFLLTFDH